MGRLIYPRHFAGLAVIAAAVLTAGHWYRPRSALVAAAAYGALYSSVTAATLRGRYTVRRKLLFVGSATVLSGLNFSVGFYGGRGLGFSAPIEYLILCAAAGAGAYGLLLRRMFLADLSLRALLWVPLVSVLAVVAVFVSGLYAKSIDALAVAWWFALSAGLWCEDRRDASG